MLYTCTYIHKSVYRWVYRYTFIYICVYTFIYIGLTLNPMVETCTCFTYIKKERKK